MRGSLVAEGSLIGRAVIEDSVIGIRARIGDGVQLHGALVMGNDRYQTETEREADFVRGIPPLGIGDGSVVRKAILDKDVRIGRNVQILNETGRQEHDGGNFYIRDGIVIVPKSAMVHDGTVIETLRRVGTSGGRGDDSPPARTRRATLRSNGPAARMSPRPPDVPTRLR